MKIVCSFDDASVQDLEIAHFLLEYGFEANTTFYFPAMPSLVNEPFGRKSLTIHEQQNIASEFEIGSHTVTHQLLTRIPIENARHEIFESKDILEQKFGSPITKFCYPRGYANPEIQSLVSEAGYESARSTLVGYIHESENRFFEQTAVHIGCDRKEYGGKGWFDYALYMLDEARSIPNSVYHLWGHGWEIDKNGATEDFVRLLKQLRNIGDNDV